MQTFHSQRFLMAPQMANPFVATQNDQPTSLISPQNNLATVMSRKSPRSNSPELPARSSPLSLLFHPSFLNISYQQTNQSSSYLFVLASIHHVRHSLGKLIPKVEYHSVVGLLTRSNCGKLRPPSSQHGNLPAGVGGEDSDWNLIFFWRVRIYCPLGSLSWSWKVRGGVL